MNDLSSAVWSRALLVRNRCQFEKIADRGVLGYFVEAICVLKRCTLPLPGPATNRFSFILPIDNHRVSMTIFRAV